MRHFICALGLAAAIGGPAHWAQTAEPQMVRGRVVDGTTGQPVQTADVSLVSLRTRPTGAIEMHGADAPRATTNLRGEFVFAVAAAGEYTVRVSKPGHMVADYGQESPAGQGKTFQVSRLASPATVVVKQWRFPVVSGTVRDQTGIGVAGATVVVLRARVRAGELTLVRAISSRTDAQGRFTFGSLLPGTYWFALSASAGHHTLYYQSAESARSAVPIELRAGETRDSVDFDVTPSTGTSSPARWRCRPT